VTPAERLKSPRVRMFVALDLPDDYVEDLVAWQEQEFGDWQELRLVPRFSLHSTLVFLGYQAEKDIDRIAELAFTDGGGPFELEGEEVVEVPPRKPRLYALGLKDAGGALGTFQDGLAQRLQEAGLYEPEKRPFWPHITLARSKRQGTRRDAGVPRGAKGGRARGGAPAQAEALPELPEQLARSFKASRLTLYSSTLRPQGAVYEVLARKTY
jgi:RNA 2',3'-cyclic 3'-phosphodiesterase